MSGDPAGAFFDAARAYKRALTGNAGIGLTQEEVDAFNAVVARWEPPESAPPPSPASDSHSTPDAPSGPEKGRSGDVPDDYWPLLAQIESGGRPYVKAASSSASGLYQFVKISWIAEGGQWGNDPAQAFGGLKPSAAEQLARIESFTAKNVAVLKARGVPINKASLYAAHFLGAATAAKVIAADVNARADLIAGGAATAANPSVLKGKSVGQFLAWLHGKTGDWAR